MKKIALLYILGLLLLASPARGAEEYKLDLSEIEKKPFHLGGFAEVRPVLSGLDRSAALYKVNFYNRDVGRTLGEFNSRLQLEGSYEEGIARVFMRVNADLNNSYLGWSNDSALYEGYLSLKPSNSLTMDFGKRTFKWGKGYAWNPVAFIDRPKDPNDPELALEGFWAGSADFIKSYGGPLKTLSFTPVLLPVINPDFNGDFGEKNAAGAGTPASSPPGGNQINVAGKLYLLLYDTDIDFVLFTGGSKPTRYGVDFSRNLSTNLELHGEFAYTPDFHKGFIDGNGNPITTAGSAKSYLLGMRYLTERDTTFILEYYRNEAGFTKQEMRAYFSFIDQGYNTYQTTGNSGPLQQAANLTQSGYGRSTPMQDYLYLRVSQKEPWDILYFTPAVTTIFNVNDQSFSVIPEILYTGITNLELRLKTFFLVGAGGTEFGEKQYDYRMEFRARYYF